MGFSEPLFPFSAMNKFCEVFPLNAAMTHPVLTDYPSAVSPIPFLGILNTPVTSDSITFISFSGFFFSFEDIDSFYCTLSRTRHTCWLDRPACKHVAQISTKSKDTTQNSPLDYNHFLSLGGPNVKQILRKRDKKKLYNQSKCHHHGKKLSNHKFMIQNNCHSTVNCKGIQFKKKKEKKTYTVDTRRQILCLVFFGKKNIKRTPELTNCQPKPCQLKTLIKSSYTFPNANNCH